MDLCDNYNFTTWEICFSPNVSDYDYEEQPGPVRLAVFVLTANQAQYDSSRAYGCRAVFESRQQDGEPGEVDTGSGHVHNKGYRHQSLTGLQVTCNQGIVTNNTENHKTAQKTEGYNRTNSRGRAI